MKWQQIDGETSETPGTAVALSEDSLPVRAAMIRTGPEDNTGDLFAGPTADATAVKLSANNDEWNIPQTDGKMFDLSGWFIRSTAASQKFVVLYAN